MPRPPAVIQDAIAHCFVLLVQPDVSAVRKLESPLDGSFFFVQ